VIIDYQQGIVIRDYIKSRNATVTVTVHF
jgi:hypothetical protein